MALGISTRRQSRQLKGWEANREVGTIGTMRTHGNTSPPWKLCKWRKDQQPTTKWYWVFPQFHNFTFPQCSQGLFTFFLEEPRTFREFRLFCGFEITSLVNLSSGNRVWTLEPVAKPFNRQTYMNCFRCVETGRIGVSEVFWGFLQITQSPNLPAAKAKTRRFCNYLYKWKTSFHIFAEI